jgi:hypothetical protein
MGKHETDTAATSEIELANNRCEVVTIRAQAMHPDHGSRRRWRSFDFYGFQ